MNIDGFMLIFKGLVYVELMSKIFKPVRQILFYIIHVIEIIVQ